jgi:hypothetical protein
VPDADLAADAAPLAGNVLYLNFEGVALTPGADDRLTNTTSLLTQAYTVPPWHDGDLARDQSIANHANDVRTHLAPYDIAVVTERPAAGPYDMLVAGGHATDAGLPAGIFSIAVNDCAAPPAKHITLVFGEGFSQRSAVQQIIAIYGIGHGIPSSTPRNDCMCFSASTCGNPTADCTIGGAGTPVDPSTQCPHDTTMDEHQLFLDALGAHP